MKKLLLLLSLVTLVNCTKEKIVTVEKIVTEEVIVTNDYTLIAIAGEGGTITKSAASESSVTLSATANEGYDFTGWSSGSTDNPLTLNIGSDQSITANFVKLIYLAENGVTVKCPDANVEDTGTVGVKEYTVVDEAQLRDMISKDEDVTCVCTSKVTSMTFLFQAVGFDPEKDGLVENSIFNQEIGSWDTSAVTNMEGMFYAATAFNQNIGSWNTAAVTDMDYMFFGAKAFDKDISSWNTSAVTDMRGMFNVAEAFNKNINTKEVTVDGLTYTAWDISQVTNMAFVFYAAIAFNQNIGSWNTAAVTDMGNMFDSASSFNQDISSWETSAVTDMSYMFDSATAFNQDISSWNTAAVTDMYAMFYDATAFNGNISSWNTAAVTDMDFMFYQATAFNQDLSGWCVQDNFDSEPNGFKTNANNTWIADASKQPDWDGASCPP